MILCRCIKRKLINFTNYLNNRRFIHLAVFFFLHLPSFSVPQSCFLLSQSAGSPTSKKAATVHSLNYRDSSSVSRTFEDVIRDHSRNRDLLPRTSSWSSIAKRNDDSRTLVVRGTPKTEKLFARGTAGRLRH